MSKSTLIAAVVFAALLAAVIFSLNEKPERGIERISFATVPPSEITRITATGKNTYEIERAEDGWRLADGRPANGSSVDQLVASIPNIESSSVVTQNPERFAELEVDDEGGTLFRAFVGDELVAEFTVGTGARGGAHIRKDDVVYLARNVRESTFRRDANLWTEKKVFDVPPQSVQRIDVVLHEGPQYALINGEAGWSLEDPSRLPEGFRFDPQQAATLGRTLAGLRAKEILPDPVEEATTGFESEADVLTMTVDGEEPLTLRLGKDAGDTSVYARASGTRFDLTVPAHIATALRKKPTDFRDLALMEMDPKRIVRLEIQSGENELVFERTSVDDAWRLAHATEETPEDFELDPAKVDSRLAALAYTRATGVAASDVRAGLDTPSATLRATDVDGETAALVFGADTERDGLPGVAARGNADQATYIAPSYARTNLTGGLETFRKTTAPPHPPALDAAALQDLPPEVRAQLLRQMARPQ